MDSRTWWRLKPLWPDEDFGPAPEDGGPHAVVERVCGEAEELVAVVGAQAVDEQGQVHGHHRLAQQHVELGLVLLPGRRHQGDQGGHAWRTDTRGVG